MFVIGSNRKEFENQGVNCICLHMSAVREMVDLPKSSWKKGIDDLSRAVHSWITQLDGRTVFGTADGTFDHNA